jgi:hypothetical protein
MEEIYKLSKIIYKGSKRNKQTFMQSPQGLQLSQTENEVTMHKIK